MADRFNGHWEQIGEGTPIVCISGFASGNWLFHRLVTPLAREHAFILPDNRGMGNSPPAQFPYDLNDLADDLLALMDRLGHARFGLIGLSMGGFIAQLLASRVPERITRMVLMCTSSNGAAFRSLFPILPREQVAMIYQLHREERVRAALSEPFCPVLTTRYPETFDYVMEQRIRNEPDLSQVLLQYDAVARFFAGPPVDLAAIQTPTLILSGALDVIVPPANAQLLASLLPHAELALVPETDHLFFLEKVNEVAQRIGSFLHPVV
ncbi:MAG: alpha/beta hydrolase [Magnetococcales bacterium]|nr:alpha/beta hydrolase [Magnetococcales bacterium]NGZ06492.1 alpha/beta hydrolase [Magnetococcales bacterium]